MSRASLLLNQLAYIVVGTLLFLPVLAFGVLLAACIVVGVGCVSIIYALASFGWWLAPSTTQEDVRE